MLPFSACKILFLQLLFQNLLTLSFEQSVVPQISVNTNGNSGFNYAASGNSFNLFRNILPQRFTFSFGLRSNFEDCTSSVIQIGHNKIKLSPRPIGQCDTCCPLQIDRHIRFLLYTRRPFASRRNTSLATGGAAAGRGVGGGGLGGAGRDEYGSEAIDGIGPTFGGDTGNELRRRRMYEENGGRTTGRNSAKNQRFSKRQIIFDNKYDLNGILSHTEPYEKLEQQGFDPKLKTVIFIHGFLEIVPGASGNNILGGYESRTESYNIIILDWSMLTTAPWYAQAIMNARFTGKVVATFLENYHKTKELPIENVHVIGFSLGAHVAGIAGKFLRVKGLKLPRITGLDPAFPGFNIKDRKSRLTYTDANYVDVIHTDASLLGFPAPIGHADFYPNHFESGSQQLQPGCQYTQLLRRNSIDDIISCSHQRAWNLYSESTKDPTAFPATRCRDWYSKSRQCDFSADAVMGFASSRENTPRGIYYLITNGQKPFSMTEAEQKQARSL